MAESAENRRKAVRFESFNMVSYTQDEREEELSVERFEEIFTGAETLDLSVSGCRVFTTDKLPLKAEFTFDIKLDDHVVSVRGRTIRARRHEHEGQRGWAVGVEFVGELSQMDRDGIELYLFESGANEM